MIWISAISLVLSICVGIGTYVAGMINAFDKLKTAGAADPNELAGDISFALFGGLLAIPLAVASLILFVIAIFRHRKFANPIQQACE